MNKTGMKTKAILLIAIFMISAFAVAIPVSAAETYSVNWDGSGDYLTIQEALAVAVADDTILVYPGTYAETFSITTSDLIIQSQSGEPSDTIIDGADAYDVMTITGCSGVTLSGFKITGTFKDGSGLYMASASDCSISNIVFGAKWLGVKMEGSSGNSFTSITFSDIEGRQPGAFRIKNSNRNTFESTTISNIVGTIQPIAIYIKNGFGNSFVDTEISNLVAEYERPGVGPIGILVVGTESYENTFTSTQISHLTGKTSSVGILLTDGASHNSFESTEISDITTTDTEGMAYGIKLKAGANSNSFSGGSISRARYGVYVEGDCPLNSIRHTNIVGNTEYGAYSDTVNLDAHLNWWGHPKGPGWTNPAGKVVNNGVTVLVDADPWLTKPTHPPPGLN